jgi:microsomal epoxide hydrolase
MQGSFLEFLPMMKIMKEKYSPDTLPFHFINPSLPGYVYSSRPPLHKNWTTTTAGDLLHKLMLSLGFGSGYMSTGGDIGANVARVMAGVYPECKGLLTNFCAVSPPEGWSDADEKKLDKMFQQGLERREQFLTTGYAYAYEHGTRTSTIGHALAASPLSLLAWIGEKFLTWTDTDPSTDDILGSVTLYWLTETFPRAIYSYRGRFEGTTKGRTHEDLVVSQDKVFGHLYYPKEIIAVPESWVARTGNLTFFKAHESGGHFAAFEKPEEMLDDITEFLEHAKQKGVTH